MRTLILPGFCLLSLAALAVAEDFLSVVPPKREGPNTPSVKAQANADFQAAAAAAKDAADLWVAPFLIADRAQRTVTVWGQAAGVAPGAEVEFFAIGEASGHDYEALMVAFAQPSDVHQALEWIGLRPGGAVDPDAHRFWPRGDRVRADFEVKLPGAEASGLMPVADWVVRPGGEGMADTPWVFVGAPRVPDPADDQKTVYAADVFSPNSLASAFNLRNTVLDLPFQGSKTWAYGQYLRNPALPVPEGQPMRLILRPAAEGTFPPELDLPINAADGVPARAGESNALARLSAAWNAPIDALWYITLDLPAELSISNCVAIAGDFRDWERAFDSLRVGPPPAGQLYYQAFLPEPAFRDRAQRPSQPLELHLVQEAGQALRAYLLELEEIWGDSRVPTIVERRTDLTDAAAWVAHFHGMEEPPQVLFLYAPASLGYGQALQWLTPVLDRLPIVYIFAEGP